MNTFNVDLNIQDCTYSCGCKNCNSSDVNITSSAQTITLQNCYILNVIAASNNSVTVLIQNGFQIIIRNIRDFETSICITTRNCTHIVTLSATINQV